MTGLDHSVHQLPLSGEGVELQDFIQNGTKYQSSVGGDGLLQVVDPGHLSVTRLV